MRKRTALLLATIAAAAALCLTAAAWLTGAAWKAAAQSPAEYNLPGMLDAITENNRRISAVNADILSALRDVEQAVAGVDRVQQRLTAMEALVAQQKQAMTGLAQASGQQVALSRQLTDLTASVKPGAAGMARTAAAEATALESMAGATQTVAGRLETINTVNRSAAGKLRRAEELTAVVLVRLP